MTLQDTYEKSLKEVLNDLQIVDVQYHTDDSGEIRKVEVQYAPVEKEDKDKKSNTRFAPF